MTTTTPKYMAVQAAALLVAGGFLVIGVLGFIPGATAHDYGIDIAMPSRMSCSLTTSS